MDGLMVVASDLQTLGYSVEKTFRVMKTFFSPREGNVEVRR